MRRRDDFEHLILAMFVVLGLTLLLVGPALPAQIAFHSLRDGNSAIYVMAADGQNQRRLTNNPHDDFSPAWFDPAFAVAPAGKKLTMWGWLKQVDR